MHQITDRTTTVIVFATLLLMLTCFVQAVTALPPEVEADRLLLSAAGKMTDKDYPGAGQDLDKIKALGVPLPVEFYYQSGRYMVGMKNATDAKKNLETYLDKAGKGGKYYQEALAIFNYVEANQKKWAEERRIAEEIVALSKKAAEEAALAKIKAAEEEKRAAEERAALAKKYAEEAALARIKAAEERATRFKDNGDGTVTDNQTGLMWAARDNGTDITWANAKQYCASFSDGGYKDWRLPTQNELWGIYEKEFAGDFKLTPFIKLSACCPWAAETRDTEAAYIYFGIIGDQRHWDLQSNSDVRRALPVRGGK